MQENNHTHQKLRVLYVINFYGTPPLNYFSKYLKEETNFELSVLKLPSVALSENGFHYEAFLLDSKGQKNSVQINWKIKIPAFGCYLLQYILNLYFGFKLTRKTEKYDLGIGETNFGSCIMYLFKKTGLVRRSSFMSGDVLPIFDGKAKPYYFNSTNRIVQFLDKSFVRCQFFLRKVGLKNDVIWYANQKIRDWDKTNGLEVKSFFIAPAVTIDKKEALENVKTTRTDNILAYIGRLDENAGVDVSLKSLVLAQKAIPDLRIIYIGGSPVSVNKYREMASKLKIENNVDFRGFIENIEDAINIYKRAKIGLALYKPDIENVSLYADVAKPKDYLRAGLPVIMTKGGPSLGYEIEKIGAGLLVNYNPEEIANLLVEVLKNRRQYDQLLEGVKRAAETYDYRPTFKFVVKRIQD